MKTYIHKLFTVAAVLFAFNTPFSTLHAQGTAFTYSGKLNNGSNPANGSYDLTFSLFGVSSGGSALAGPLTNSATGVTNGLFTVTLDFGSVFNGANRWLEIGVRTNGNGAYTTLAPRQELTPTPYAIFANTASNLSGVLPVGQLNGKLSLSQLPGAVVTNNNTTPLNLTGTFAGNGGGLTNLPASGGAASNVWSLGGNNVTPGKFLGSTNNQPVEVWVNGVRAFRLEPNTNGAPNVIGGSPVNFVAPGAVGATIGGGGASNYYGDGITNSVSDDFETVAGGANNQIEGNAADSTIGGGGANLIQSGSLYSTIGGGYDNLILINSDSTIGGGNGNTIEDNAYASTIGGGFGNLIITNAYESTIGGGDRNQIQVSANYSTISGGSLNQIQDNSYSSTIGGGDNNQIKSGSFESTIGGGDANVIYYTSDDSTIGGGVNNQIQDFSSYSTIAGGDNNTIRYGLDATIAGGSGNYAGYYVTQTGNYSSVGGGYGNTAQGNYSTTPGGNLNWAPGTYSFAAGNRAKAIYDGDFSWADSQNADFNSTGNDQFCIRAQGGVQLDNSTSIYLGNQTRQMINLYQNGYGIGVQNYTEYFRSGEQFAWFVGGVHNDVAGNPGGGLVVMTLGTGGLYVNGYLASLSDRNVKAGFALVNTRTVLEKVAAMPITRWYYTNDMAIPHLGPMAQDFYAAFNVGPDDKHITTIDEGGVALAAIQGLNEKVESGTQKAESQIQKLEAENGALKQENDLLAARLNELDAAVKSLTNKK